jgi:hypothetical protein
MPPTKLDYGLAGALLLELALSERIDIVGARPNKAETIVLDDAPLGTTSSRTPSAGSARSDCGRTGSSRAWQGACEGDC